jgi:hypothetical protein
MIETPVEQPAMPLPPLQRHQQLEIDTFCTTCGYNLHGQPVTRDPQLGLFVCRCPECGQHHPAGVGVTAASVWSARLATALLALWVAIVVNAFIWISIGLGALTVSHIEMFTWTKLIAPDGREVEYMEVPASTGGGGGLWTTVYKGTTQPAVGQQRTVRTLEAPRSEDFRWRWRFMVMNAVLAGGTALLSGALLVVFIWHWPRRRYWLVMLLPFVIATFVAAIFYVTDTDDEYGAVRGWIVSRSMEYAALEAACFAVGIWIGRPAARGLLRMFIPPKPRQHFSFLWRIDGKTPPATA